MICVFDCEFLEFGGVNEGVFVVIVGGGEFGGCEFELGD